MTETPLRAAQLFFLNGHIDSIEKMVGDASTRIYYRVKRSTDAPLVVMQTPDGEAVTQFETMTTLMKTLGVDTPALYGSHGSLLALEDCGDTLLETALAAAGAEERIRLYKKVIDSLHAFQQRVGEGTEREEACFRLSFDAEKLQYEIDFCGEHFIENHCGISMTVAEKKRLADAWQPIITELAAEMETLCHRDFHSRNILLHEGRLVWIDYQDARRGRLVYDLVSLLHDPYVTLTTDEIALLTDYYYSLFQSPPWPRSRFDRLYNYAAVQRLYKALGTFGYQTAVRGKDDYRVAIAPARDTLHDILLAEEALAPLHTLLQTSGFFDKVNNL